MSPLHGSPDPFNTPPQQKSTDSNNQNYINQIDTIQLDLYENNTAGALSRLTALVSQMNKLSPKTVAQQDALMFLQDCLNRLQHGAGETIISELGNAKNFLYSN